ncbi:potassium channel subfamily k member 9 [Plakobranchus ocellatus]|uniref:Potassium channel subfamily k member 9 n=1 Tax=Plakobranchus ocellatus TaxID=259542 RepID=A0AAV3XY34_9GAST|nr:potassium channel subfamily k member 9 [Plakobranchus ocellatus]
MPALHQDTLFTVDGSKPRGSVLRQKGTIKLIVILSGLLFAMWGYLLFGATLFLLVETYVAAEKINTSVVEIHLERQNLLDKLEKIPPINVTNISCTLNRNAIQIEIQNYEDFLFGMMKKIGKASQKHWTYDSSLLFAASLITTVGYGHIYPATNFGRLLTIAYSCVGIPLFLVCIAILGTIMARGFKAAAVHLFGSSVTESGVAYIPLKVSASVMIIYLLIGAFLFQQGGKWGFFESFYFCFITLSTIGLGDYVYGEKNGGKDANFVFNVFYILFGLSVLSMCFNLMQEQVTYLLHQLIVFMKEKVERIVFCLTNRSK